MNVTVAKALGLDALYQVLDNRVFRILVVVTAVVVLFPVLVAFRDEELVILFGWRRYTYAEVFENIGSMFGIHSVAALEPGEMQELAVTVYREVIVNGLMGQVGIFLGIAATAFFVPQMIDKGAGDTLFSKPVSRLALLLGRYVAGLLFVGLLASLLVGGTFLTLLISSGYSDTDFLWTALSLTYKFALVYGVTTLFAVFTRSTVASILLTLIFLMVNGCVHTAWNGYQMSLSVDQEERHDVEVELGEATGEPDPFFETLGTVFNGLHYALPKTGDASAVTNKLRAALSGDDDELYTDPDIEFALLGLPPGFQRLDAGSLADEDRFHPAIEGDTVVWAAGHGGTDADARLVIHKRPERELSIGSSDRPWPETTKRAADGFEEWVEEGGDRELVAGVDAVTIAEGTTWPKFARELSWATDRGGERWNVRTLIVNEDDWILAMQLETRGDWLDDHPDVADHFGGRDYRFGSGSLASLNAAQDPDAWFAERLSWTGDWRFTIWFSVGSSLAFLAACLALGWWRLSRIDF